MLTNYNTKTIDIESKIQDINFTYSTILAIYELWLLWNLLHGQINWVYKRNFQLNIKTE